MPDEAYPADEIQHELETAIGALRRVDAAWTDDALVVTGVALDIDDPANRRRHFPSNERLDTLRQVLMSIEQLLDEYLDDSQP
jgi:hypothetical protein